MRKYEILLVMVVLIFLLSACSRGDGGEYETIVTPAPVNVRDLAWVNENEDFMATLRGLFGDPQVYAVNEWRINYCFGNGATVTVMDGIKHIIIDYTETANDADFHFNGINGTYTENALEAAFQGEGLRWTGASRWGSGTRLDYNFALFFFNEDRMLRRMEVFVSLPSPRYAGVVDIEPHMGQTVHVTRGYWGRMVAYTDASRALNNIYFFENGVTVSCTSISAITLNFEEMADNTAFNFRGIDGTFTREDVLAIMGEPCRVVEDAYLFCVLLEWCECEGFEGWEQIFNLVVHFAFNEAGYVQEISYFLPV
ncbi:MAG: hypothetical protein FWC16_07605 [Defluviitaleaceae bacterium]|nr:hypothetical protein [Defluviitaleaceae bacterium]MCL2274780.1 hypothetical protein [Defluviitaleaceae bacterium]